MRHDVYNILAVSGLWGRQTRSILMNHILACSQTWHHDLVYKYRLQGVFIAFFLIAALYIWKNGVHFVPPQEDSDRSGRSVKSEKDQLDALVSLLKRYIAPEDLLKTCITEWANTTIKAKRPSADNIPTIKELEVLAAINDKPSQIYNSICKKLIERKQP
jgi:hypothetical protein